MASGGGSTLVPTMYLAEAKTIRVAFACPRHILELTHLHQR